MNSDVLRLMPGSQLSTQPLPDGASVACRVTQECGKRGGHSSGGGV